MSTRECECCGKPCEVVRDEDDANWAYLCDEHLAELQEILDIEEMAELDLLDLYGEEDPGESPKG